MKKKVIITITILLLFGTYQIYNIKKENEQIRLENAKKANQDIVKKIKTEEKEVESENEVVLVSTKEETQEESEVIEEDTTNEAPEKSDSKTTVTKKEDIKIIEKENKETDKNEPSSKEVVEIQEPDDKENQDSEEIVEEDNDEDEVTLSDSEIADVESSVTTSDKAKAAALVFKRLSASQIVELKNLASDGFTTEEKQKALAMLNANFTAEEQTYIWALYAKYTKGD